VEGENDQIWRYKVQAMNPADYPRRQEFSQWFHQRCAAEIRFPSVVLLTDEASFTRESIINSSNNLFNSSLNIFDDGAVLLRSILWTLSIVCMFCNHNVSRDGPSFVTR
jgi:hypothetical protein